MKIKANDTVLVTAGKDKGKKGKVLKTFPKLFSVTVEGANMYKRHRKPLMGKPGGIFDNPRPLALAKVALICPKCHKQTRVGYQIDPDLNKKSRICKKCKKII